MDRLKIHPIDRYEPTAFHQCIQLVMQATIRTIRGSLLIETCILALMICMISVLPFLSYLVIAHMT